MGITVDILYTVRDENGKESDTEINVSPVYVLSQYREFAVKMAELIDDIIGGVIVQALVCFGIDLTTVAGNPTVPDPLSDVEEKGYFKFRTIFGRSVDVKVPCLDESLVADGTDDIDLSEPSVQAFVDAFDTGFALSDAGSLIRPVDIDGDELDGLQFARESYDPRSVRG